MTKNFTPGSKGQSQGERKEQGQGEGQGEAVRGQRGAEGRPFLTYVLGAIKNRIHYYELLYTVTVYIYIYGIYIYGIYIYIWYVWLIASDIYTRTFNATYAVSRLTAGKCKLLGA